MVHLTVALYDAHLRTSLDEATKAYHLARRFVKDIKPDEIVIGGDMSEIASLSGWARNKRLSMEGKRYVDEVALLNSELDYYQKHAKSVVYLEGNHEQWVSQYIDENPAMEGILNLPKALSLKDRGIKWYPYTHKGKLYRRGKLHYIHGYYWPDHHAKKHLTTFGVNLLYGHVHRSQKYVLNMQMQPPLQAWSIGCLCDQNPDFRRGQPSGWTNGFAVIQTDMATGDFSVQEVVIDRDRFIYDGKVYK